MTDAPRRRRALRLGAAAWMLATAISGAQDKPPAPPLPPPYQPSVGQEGKDVIWVPTQPKMVDRMLRMAQVTPRDLVVDLGSGDGRIPIAAARDFGSAARGLEYNPDLVALSRHAALAAGVADRVSFEEADIFKADFSDATVVTMFLMPGILMELRPLLLKMKPGTRLVSNQFDLGDWIADEQADIGGRLCFLWIVPARVAGNWQFHAGTLPDGFEINLEQGFQHIEGWFAVAGGKAGLRDALLTGPRLRFALVDDHGVLHEFDGRVEGDSITGSVRSGGAAPAPFTGRRWSNH
jgi:SAM-dependent methyltransferase